MIIKQYAHWLYCYNNITNLIYTKEIILKCISLIYRQVIYTHRFVAVVVGAIIAFESEVTSLYPTKHFIKNPMKTLLKGRF